MRSAPDQSDPDTSFTALLAQAADQPVAQADVQAEVLDRVYAELHRLARHYMSSERDDHTLQPTALVHEAYLQLFGREQVPWANRAHFFGAAAIAMRRILVDHARRRGRAKRGGERRRLPASVMDLLTVTDSDGILSLDEALQRLEGSDRRAAEVVKLRFFAGLSVEDTAATMQLSKRTVIREWNYARAWLFQELKRE